MRKMSRGKNEKERGLYPIAIAGACRPLLSPCRPDVEPSIRKGYAALCEANSDTLPGSQLQTARCSNK